MFGFGSSYCFQAPMFVAVQHQLVVEEGIRVGEEIGRVLAIDDDLAENGRIFYSLNGSDHFEIDENTGIIFTAAVIDREKMARYDVLVRKALSTFKSSYQ